MSELMRKLKAHHITRESKYTAFRAKWLKGRIKIDPANPYWRAEYNQMPEQMRKAAEAAAV